jgi:hypothetical protein
MASFKDNETGLVSTYPLFLKGVGLTLKTVFDNLAAVRREFLGNPIPAIAINDYKSLLGMIDPPDNYNVYDYGILKQPAYGTLSTERAQEICEKYLAAASTIRPKPWMKLLGRASTVYNDLQRRGVMNGHAHVFPRYVLDTVSGRSKTLDFNVQGTDASYDIRHPIGNRPFLIHLDWISADLKAAQIMSKDEFLARAFATSDPYAVMAKGDLTRDDCKLMMIKALYELDLENPAIQFYPTLYKWIAERKEDLQGTGYTQSILGRKFKLAKEGDVAHNIRSVFNASLQGTVVHAMHSALWNIQRMMPGIILAETHDAITLAVDRRDVKAAVEVGIKAMLHPFEGILEDNPSFPLRVYAGRSWKKWNLSKEVR